MVFDKEGRTFPSQLFKYLGILDVWLGVSGVFPSVTQNSGGT
jgi:hypothetical protein